MLARFTLVFILLTVHSVGCNGADTNTIGVSRKEGKRYVAASPITAESQGPKSTRNNRRVKLTHNEFSVMLGHLLRLYGVKILTSSDADQSPLSETNSISIAEAVKKLRQKGYEIDNSQQENDAVYITIPDDNKDSSDSPDIVDSQQNDQLITSNSNDTILVLITPVATEPPTPPQETSTVTELPPTTTSPPVETSTVANTNANSIVIVVNIPPAQDTPIVEKSTIPPTTEIDTTEESATSTTTIIPTFTIPEETTQETTTVPPPPPLVPIVIIPINPPPPPQPQPTPQPKLVTVNVNPSVVIKIPPPPKPSCPTFSDIASSSTKVWKGLVNAEGSKAKLLVLSGAADNAVTTLKRCAKKLAGQLASLLFTKSENESDKPYFTLVNVNIKTSDGRQNGQVKLTNEEKTEPELKQEKSEQEPNNEKSEPEPNKEKSEPEHKEENLEPEHKEENLEPEHKEEKSEPEPMETTFREEPRDKQVAPDPLPKLATTGDIDAIKNSPRLQRQQTLWQSKKSNAAVVNTRSVFSTSGYRHSVPEKIPVEEALEDNVDPSMYQLGK